MRIVVLGGYGEIGTCICTDLAQTAGDFDVIVAGRDRSKAQALVKLLKAKHLRAESVDVNNSTSLRRLLKGTDVVINATNYYMNVKVMKAALASGANYLDLGGLFHTTVEQLKLHSKFKEKGLLAVVGCGSTPGITNILALHGANQLDKVESIHFQFGDKDSTRYNMPLVVPYSMHTVFDEFMKRPAVFTNGRTKFVEPLTGEIEVGFPAPVGRITCRYSLHSEVATIPASFRDKGIRECSFRGGWDSDFIAKTKFLIDAGFASYKPILVDGTMVSPRNVAVSLLNRFIPTGKAKINDLELLRVEVTGSRKGKRRKMAVYCRAVSNKRWNIPAGTWDTGVPPSIVAQMIARGDIVAKGVLPPEKMGMNLRSFFSELRARDMDVFIRQEN